ncbi:MAG: type II toxin-antitoxin system PemK/MazF family toxin [Candidatus Dormibacteraeota bacterium]|nr:type II toxin-antitoxin system PemK/MazF family toxin [Candidatus Dormibacteraeota bacterium]
MNGVPLARGQVWWARVDKRRPVLLLSPARTLQNRRRVLVAPLSTRLRFNDATVELGPAEGVPRRSVVNLENLVSLSRADLDSPLTTLDPRKLRAVCRALAYATGCAEV